MPVHDHTKRELFCSCRCGISFSLFFSSFFIHRSFVLSPLLSSPFFSLLQIVYPTPPRSLPVFFCFCFDNSKLSQSLLFDCFQANQSTPYRHSFNTAKTGSAKQLNIFCCESEIFREDSLSLISFFPVYHTACSTTDAFKKKNKKKKREGEIWRFSKKSKKSKLKL